MAGVSIEPSEHTTLSLAIVSSSATSIAAVAAVTGTVVKVYRLFLVAAGTTNIQFQDGTTGLSGAMPFAANGSITLDMDGTPWFVTTAGNAFTINSSGGNGVFGTVYYTQNKFFA